MTNAFKNITLVSSLALATIASNGAQAQGFLGGIINQIAPGVRTEMDRINHNLGNPVDHAAAAALDTFVPGSGGAVEAGWAVQRSGMLDDGRGTRGDTPVPMPLTQAYGNVCITQAGYFLGPMNPLGMSCQVMTPYGVVGGYVGR